MKRLTVDTDLSFCDIAQCDYLPGGSFCEDGRCDQRRCYEKLREYERSDLEPETLRKAQGLLKELKDARQTVELMDACGKRVCSSEEHWGCPYGNEGMTDCAVLLEAAYEDTMDYQTAFAMMMVKKQLQSHVEFLQSEELKLAEKYAEKDEKGNIKWTERGTFPYRDADAAAGYQRERRALGMTQVEDDFTVQHAPVPEKITPMQLEALEKFIVFGGDGVATDSFVVDVASTGDFTACCSYLGYPCFFKEEHIYKVYGDKPSNFQVMGSASLGVEKGSDESLAIAGETLFYLSRTGIVAWSGGIPQSVSAAFGTQRFRNGVAGSDGTKYFVSLQDAQGVYQLFAFDTRTNLWHREDSTQAVGWGWNEELYCLDATGKLWMNGNARSVPQGAVQEELVAWKAEWADFYEYTTYSSSSTATPEKKGIGKLLLRLELDEDASVQIDMQFDSDGVWRTVKTLQTEVKRSYYLPIIPRRCDHFRIRMTGNGGCRLYSLVREVYNGSEL